MRVEIVEGRWLLIAGSGLGSELVLSRTGAEPLRVPLRAAAEHAGEQEGEIALADLAAAGPGTWSISKPKEGLAPFRFGREPKGGWHRSGSSPGRPGCCACGRTRRTTAGWPSRSRPSLRMPRRGGCAWRTARC